MIIFQTTNKAGHTRYYNEGRISYSYRLFPISKKEVMELVENNACTILDKNDLTIVIFEPTEAPVEVIEVAEEYTAIITEEVTVLKLDGSTLKRTINAATGETLAEEVVTPGIAVTTETNKHALSGSKQAVINTYQVKDVEIVEHIDIRNNVIFTTYTMSKAGKKITGRNKEYKQLKSYLETFNKTVNDYRLREIYGIEVVTYLQPVTTKLQPTESRTEPIQTKTTIKVLASKEAVSSQPVDDMKQLELLYIDLNAIIQRKQLVKSGSRLHNKLLIQEENILYNMATLIKSNDDLMDKFRRYQQ